MRGWWTPLVALWPGLAMAHAVPCQRSSEVTVSSQYTHVFDAAGRRFKVDPDLGRALAWVESNFNPDAVSKKGAKGLMQLMPDTISQLSVRDPFDPILNIYGGMEYLHWLADNSRFAGNPYMVLVAYNAGPNRTVYPKSSYAYADLITAIYWQLKDRQHDKIAAPSPHVLTPPACNQVHLTVAMRWKDGKLLPSKTYARR